MATAFSCPESEPGRAAGPPPTGVFAGLSLTQRTVAFLLAQGLSHKAAAAEAGIHRTTIHHWERSNPVFLLACEQARQEAAAKLRDQYLALAPLAIDALRDILANPRTPASTQLKAALTGLNHAMVEIDPARLYESLPPFPPATDDTAGAPVHDGLGPRIHHSSSLDSDRLESSPAGIHHISSLPQDHDAPESTLPHELAGRPAPDSETHSPTHRPSSLLNVQDLVAETIAEVRQARLAILGKPSALDSVQPYRAEPKPGRNHPCPCNSGRKYKNCCRVSGAQVRSA